LAGVKDVSTHDFRHTKATTLLNQGAPLDMVQDLLGHASPATTKTIYAHYEQTRLREAFDHYSLSAQKLAEKRSREHRADATDPIRRAENFDQGTEPAGLPVDPPDRKAT
jgi:hypothetical protein